MIKVLMAVLVMAVVTYIPRVIPIAVFNKKIKSQYIKSFLYYIPFAVLGAMTFPNVFFSTSLLISAIAGTVVALILSYFEKGLMTVAASAVFAVYLVELFLQKNIY